MKTRMLRAQSGLSLLEVLIAVVVLSAGLLGLAGLQVAGLKSSQNTTAQQQATLAVYNLLEKMRANRQAAIAGSYSSPTPYTAAMCDRPIAVGCQYTTCTSTQIAQQDIRDIMCGTNSTSGSGGALTQNAGVSLRISCTVPTDCSQGIEFDVQWTERKLDEVKGSVAIACGDGSLNAACTFNVNRDKNNPVSMQLRARL
ncbi:type IV pilus modification protein PilV [Thiolinea disciformis]|uniref:type IV pilus modification protein PilV n=1 Tax=Thiolinea disciformis TaxID=125614 RepID=UPI000A04C02A|nr:type IV pilus modification protein PilV [Thiolinea disciformis]